MTKNKHSIQKVFLEIDTSSMQMANSIKDNLAVFLQNELVPILEKQFNLMENYVNQIVQIEKLELSIDTNHQKNDTFLSNSEVKNDLKIQLEKALQKALSELKNIKKETKNVSEINRISTQDKDLKTLLFFIENGSMPWWISKGDDIGFFEKITIDELKKEAFSSSFRKLIQQEKVQKRLVNQFSNQEIVLFTAVLFGTELNEKNLSKNNFLQLLNKKPHHFKASFWQLIFNASFEKTHERLLLFYDENKAGFASEKWSFELFIQDLKALFPTIMSDAEFKQLKDDYYNQEKEKTSKSPDSTRVEMQNSSSEKEFHPEDKPNESQLFPIQQSNAKSTHNEDDFAEERTHTKSSYVQNAGLILLHPFLKELLKRCDLIENNMIINKELASHILHFAATKKENDYEHAMLFEKFLCGIPMQQSIQREIEIEDGHKQQVEEMLLAVVANWSALKNTSTDILRTEFLQREGKLDWSDTNPKLTIERKTQDLLLEKIPWNINIVKIPWMEKLIYTQW